MEGLSVHRTADSIGTVSKRQAKKGIATVVEIKLIESLSTARIISIEAFSHFHPTTGDVWISTLLRNSVAGATDSGGRGTIEDSAATKFITTLGIGKDWTNGNKEFHPFLLVTKLQVEVAEGVWLLRLLQRSKDDLKLSVGVSALLPRCSRATIGFHMGVSNETQGTPCS